MDVSLLAVGVAVVRLVLRLPGIGEPGMRADAFADSATLVTLLRAKQSAREDELGRVIAAQLADRLGRPTDETLKNDLEASARDVAALLNRLAEDDEAVVEAAVHPHQFPAYVMQHGGSRLLYFTAEAATPFTERLLQAACETVAVLAPQSKRFPAGALTTILRKLEALPGLAEDARRAAEAAEENRSAGGRTSVEASREATRQSAKVGSPITAWEPEQLGVHPAISVGDETGLPPYIPRGFDSRLRARIASVRDGRSAVLVLVVGTSCAGKTRALYEAVREVLAGWSLVAPQDDSALARQLAIGVPAHTVVWLDELQRHLTITREGIAAARGVSDLLATENVGPIVFAGTSWPSNVRHLKDDKPTADDAKRGAHIVSDLLRQAHQYNVPDDFTKEQLATANPDARLLHASATAHDRHVTQVLAGGTQLVARMHPTPAQDSPPPFSAGAVAVLTAAADLRRVGYPNPIPRWALEGASPGYLKATDAARLRPDRWIGDALDELTTDAEDDNSVTGRQTLDIHARGVPALTPQWIMRPGEPTSEAYDIHDYLVQDTLTHRRKSPTAATLWGALTKPEAVGRIAPSVARVLGANAECRGLYTFAASLYGAAGSQSGRVHALAARGDDAALAEIQALVAAGDGGAKEEVLQLLAARGDDNALAAYRDLVAQRDSDYPDPVLLELYVARGDQDALEDMWDLAWLDKYARRRLGELLAIRKDDAGLARLRAGLAEMREERLKARPKNDTDFAKPEDAATAGDGWAPYKLAQLLAARRDETSGAELRARADNGDWFARDALIEMLGDVGNDGAVAELRTWVHAAEPEATRILMSLYAVRFHDRGHIAELDTEAMPVFSSRTSV